MTGPPSAPFCNCQTYSSCSGRPKPPVIPNSSVIRDRLWRLIEPVIAILDRLVAHLNGAIERYYLLARVCVKSLDTR
jgi:hypothetical protein